MKQAGTNIGRLATIHGLYYLAAGMWPLLHIESFVLITGPKTDLWLVKTVSVLVLAIGVGLVAAAFQERISLATGVIATSSAAGLTLIDVFYVWEGAISPVYLLDALIETLLFLTWVFYIIKTTMWSTKRALNNPD